MIAYIILIGLCLLTIVLYRKNNNPCNNCLKCKRGIK